MKVCGILTVASFCLTGLIDAAPVDGFPESRINKFDKNGEKEIDYEYFLKSLDAINEKHKTGSFG